MSTPIDPKWERQFKVTMLELTLLFKELQDEWSQNSQMENADDAQIEAGGYAPDDGPAAQE